MTRNRSLTVAACVALSVSAATARAQSAEVDLLHAVATELAVSSAYRDQRAQVDRLVDGDPATAWNSRTGDLVGAWIEVRLPADVQVSAIGIVPGFARPGGATDLFTGNHRVARIRVLREGTEVGTFAVEHARPEMVRVPVSGAGGVWRIELAELTPGTRSDWREACVSELQILGRAASSAPGARTPRTAVGTLPDPPAAAVVDPAALERAHRRDASWIGGAWRELDATYVDYAGSSGEPTPEDPAVQRDIDQRRAALLRRVTTLVEPIDPARADALRMAGQRRLTGPAWQWVGTIRGDLDAIDAALSAVAERLATDEARCRSARASAELRLVRVAGITHAALMVSGDYGSAVERDDTALVGASEEWSRNSRGVSTRLLRRTTPPAVSDATADWTALRTHLETMQRTCPAR